MTFTNIKFQDPATRTYLGSPSLLRLDNGDLLATHDYFGPGCPRNHEHEEHLLSVYRSRDDGATWTNVTHVAGQYWSNLFAHRGAVYLFGVSQQYGSIVIRRSDDGGNTWTYPHDEKSGLLFRGGPYHDNPNYHCAPMPVLHHDGWLYRAFEDCRDARWGVGFQSLMVACPEDADLLDAGNWIMSNKLAFDPAWLPEDWPPLDGPGYLEGNAVATPDGEIWNILRCHSAPVVDKAVVLRVEHGRGRIRDGSRIAGSYPAHEGTSGPDSGGEAAAMRPLHAEPLQQEFLRIIDFPGGMTKFTIRRDPQTGLYVTISNNNTDPRYASQRNVLSLHSSEDLIHWTHRRTLLEDDLGLPWEESVRQTGFQYVDWQFDGADIIYLVRTAYDGAHNFHDANRLTFHRIEDWRQAVHPSL
ncbi:MAG: glycoside hydrolase [Armatimonadetes bacterium]|nr:glycoside hydrolase [Armatimonadota bacterium]